MLKIHSMQIVLNKTQIDQKIMRLAHQVLENSSDEQTVYLAGICGNGIRIAREIARILTPQTDQEIHVFEISLDKDHPLEHAITMDMDAAKLKNGFIVLIDDVINSGKTMQYALVKLLEHPVKAIKTVALVDRRHRRYPVKCDYVGITLSTTLKNRVEINFDVEDYAANLI